MTRKEKIEKIGALPALLERAVAGLTPEQLDTPYREGGWTRRQVVHHLADSHMNAFIRFKLMLAEDNPTFKTYEQDNWATHEDARTMDIQPSLDIIRGLHARWHTMLSGVAEADWARTGTHPENGPVTLDRMLDIYSGHGEKHIGHISV